MKEEDTENQIHSVCSCVSKENWGEKPRWDIFTHASKRSTKAHTPHCSLAVAIFHGKQEWWLRPAIATYNTSAWPCCVCSVNLDSGYGCRNQRWSSKTSCGCSSCRRSICGSSSCCGYGYGWRCYSKRRRWSSGCWRKDWGGSKGWVAFWHCGEIKQCVHLILCSYINSTCRMIQQD